VGSLFYKTEFKANTQLFKTEAYHWLRDNTPEDSRVLAWWDYGYQINGVANRTSIADGNTWNHEHIALLGRVLISPEVKENSIFTIRSFLNYFHRGSLIRLLVIWLTTFLFGQQGGPVCMAMIWLSAPIWLVLLGLFSLTSPSKVCFLFLISFIVIFNDFLEFYMMNANTPSPELGKSLLYQLHSYGIVPSVPKPQFFDEAYTTTNRMVRIYKVLDLFFFSFFLSFIPRSKTFLRSLKLTALSIINTPLLLIPFWLKATDLSAHESLNSFICKPA
jgi:dolichyl-diphosphooligosaccharide--protein glycosyltransferase